MIGEDLQNISGSCVMRTSVIGRVPIRNLPKSRVQKTDFEKIFIFQWDIFRIQSDKTPIGLHGKGGKSSLSDRGPWVVIALSPDMFTLSVENTFNDEPSLISK